LKQVVDPVPIAVGKGDEAYTVVGGDKVAFPVEYSVSGWFKWETTNQ
jgi:hypothetical protein